MTTHVTPVLLEASDLLLSMALLALGTFLVGYGVSRSIGPAALRQWARWWFLARCWWDESMPVRRKTARAEVIAAYVRGRGEGWEEGRKSALETLARLKVVSRRPS